MMEFSLLSVSAKSAAVCLVMCAHFTWCQTTAAKSGATAADASAALTSFDVVSVKPVVPGSQLSFSVPVGNSTVRVAFLYAPDGVHWARTTVSSLIRAAYGNLVSLSMDDGVTGLPDWAKTERFEVQGKMSDAQAAAFAKLGKNEQNEQREVMLRALLADRFQLKVHREPKQVPDYELVVAKGGLKIKESETNPDSTPDKDQALWKPGNLTMTGEGQATARAMGMEEFASFFAVQGPMGVGRLVEDKTGLTGKYSFTLRWTPYSGTESDAAGDSTPSIFTALQEQLGLKLQPGTRTIDTVVVDHVERPTPD